MKETRSFQDVYGSMEAGLTRQFQSQKLTDLAKALVSKKK